MFYLYTTIYFGIAAVFAYVLCRLVAWTWTRQRDAAGGVHRIAWTVLSFSFGCGALVPFLLFDRWVGDFRQNEVHSWYVVGLFVLSLVPGSIFLIRKRAALEKEDGSR